MQGHQFNCKQISEQEHQRISQNRQNTQNPNTKTSWNWRKADTTDGKKKSAASDGAFSTHKY